MPEYNGPERREHNCVQITTITVMKEHIARSTAAWERIENKLNNGLSTQVSLNKSSIERAWWWLGAISVGVFGACIALVKGQFGK